jgi:polyisoprenoid-binding protein YceI
MLRIVALLLMLATVPAAAQQRALALSPANTTIAFSIGALGLFSLEGRFTRFAGELRLDERDIARTQVAVLVDTTSVEAEGGASDLARDLDLLRTREFPTMVFRSLTVTRGADGAVRLDGILTLAGVTRPLQLTARRDSQTIAAAGVLERGAHGLTALRPILADRVRLSITIATQG